ncbi:MAG TPA: hypothetical protein VF278_10250 [Pirellulales bacterium]
MPRHGNHLALAVCLFLLASQTVFAQGVRRRAMGGAASMSQQIYADAATLRATGDFLIDTGIARKLHAEAASMEMDNAVKWVSTYFERRRLNKEARAAEHPGYLDHLEKVKENYRRIHDKGLAAGADLSDDMNWMLREILNHVSVSVFVADGPRGVAGSEYNLPLSADDRHKIRVTESSVAGGKGMIFRIDTAELLETPWPVVLRDERFKAARDAFELARDCALGDLSTGIDIVSEENRRQLTDAVDRLSGELAAAYPSERRRKLSPRDGLAKVEADNFLRSLATSTFRLIATNSNVAFDQSYRFKGDSVADLLRHLMSKGLEFAPCEKGGEAVYRNLYNCVRGYYLDLVPKPDE